MDDRQAAAHRLVRHLRRCCSTFVDGIVRLPRRSFSFWEAKISNSARFWGYPILTTAAADDCKTLSIRLPERLFRMSGFEQLSALLRVVQDPLSEVLLQVAATETRISVLGQMEPNRYFGPRVVQLPSIFASLLAQPLPGLSLYLHGSFADLQYTAFSDVDDLVVLHRSAWQDPHNLRRMGTQLAWMARSFQNVDPFQHHGHWLLTELDLLLYDQTYMPLVVLENALRVSGERDIKCRLRFNPTGFRRNLDLTIQATYHALDLAARRRGLNAFDIKKLAGQIVLIPAYLFQVQGEMLSKPRAIQRASELFSPFAMQAIEWSTLVRREFAPLVNNSRVRIAGWCAHLTCPRRYQAESLLRRCSPWVSQCHPLGLNESVISTIRALISECQTTVKEVST